MLVLDEGAQRVMRSGELHKRDELWLGDARNPHNDDELVPVYLRIAKPTPLVAELLCAVIARALHLPAPEAFVIVVEAGALEGSKLCSAGKRELYVGTRDVGGDTFSQLLREDSAHAHALISQWEHLMPVTAFDEWLANPDRNWGNIIYAAQALHIIDHAEAFGGTTRSLFPLAEITHDAFTNRLALMLEDPKAEVRHQHLQTVESWLKSAAGGLDIAAVVASADIRRWQTAEEEAELVHFISTRLTITHRLLCSRLGHPQLAISH